ncbi:unc-22 [Bugula neritina]|uniref:Unc-22 n=1 Tax=Bugula neritina TaxID=10212 RepID=A0A7J7IZ54_BUGNE|nr:unc-22 [Bugula neritina]
MQKYSGRSYGLKVSRVKKAEDAGKYSVSASNSFGQCETSFHLEVIAETPIEVPKVHLDIPTRKVELIEVEKPNLERKPYFSFPLRDRFIQEKDDFKLTATIDSDVLPLPKIQWLKGGKEISAGTKYTCTYSSGRCSLEVSNAELTDAGKYSCIATNKLGEAECSCTVEISEAVRGLARRSSSIQPVGSYSITHGRRGSGAFQTDSSMTSTSYTTMSAHGGRRGSGSVYSDGLTSLRGSYGSMSPASVRRGSASSHSSYSVSTVGGGRSARVLDEFLDGLDQTRTSSTSNKTSRQVGDTTVTVTKKTRVIKM